jgi:hypothetical protein
MPKAKKVGRPKLPKGAAKGRIVPVRFDSDDLILITLAAKVNNQAVSEWIRDTLRTAAEKSMFNRTLHEAMRVVLAQLPEHKATSSLLAEEIAKTNLYKRKDGMAARAQQINARARKYPMLFDLSPSGEVTLRSTVDNVIQQ